jgi:hypothetical protein
VAWDECSYSLKMPIMRGPTNWTCPTFIDDWITTLHTGDDAARIASFGRCSSEWNADRFLPEAGPYAYPSFNTLRRSTQLADFVVAALDCDPGAGGALEGGKGEKSNSLIGREKGEKSNSLIGQIPKRFPQPLGCKRVAR